LAPPIRDPGISINDYLTLVRSQNYQTAPMLRPIEVPKRENKYTGIFGKASSTYLNKSNEKPQQSEKRIGVNQSVPKEFLSLA
jgi:hypothetical protein